MNRSASFYVGILVITISLAAFAMSSLYLKYIIEYVRIHISSDNVVTDVGVRLIRLRFFFLLFSITAFGTLLVFDVFKKVANAISLKDAYATVGKVFFKDHLCRNLYIGKYFFFTASSIAILIHLLVLIFGEPEWEGTIDKYSSALFFVSALVLLVPIFKLSGMNIAKKKKRLITIILLAIAALFIFIYGEEISWGQQYFQIETSDFFKLNYQSENTIHNFFNPLFVYLYPAVGFASFILLTYFWFIAQPEGEITNLFLPHVSLYVFFLLMAGATYTGTNELYEAYLSICTLFYSLRIVMCIFHPSDVFRKSLAQN